MYYSLRGKLIYKDETAVAIECGGVGYRCYVTMNTLADMPEEGNETMVYTHLNVREDLMELFGFSSKDELNCFKILTSVSGVGAKMGVSILSVLSPNQVATAVASGDNKTLTMAPGVGNKLAQRIILELRDKVSKITSAEKSRTSSAIGNIGSANVQNAMSALLVLGYSQSESLKALAGLDENLKVEELIKGALKTIAGRA